MWNIQELYSFIDKETIKDSLTSSNNTWHSTPMDAVSYSLKTGVY